jgi:hypothetical protein
MEVLYYKDYKGKNLDNCIVDFLIQNFNMDKDYIFYHNIDIFNEYMLINILKNGIDSNFSLLDTKIYIEEQNNYIFKNGIDSNFSIILDGYKLLKDKISYWSIVNQIRNQYITDGGTYMYDYLDDDDEEYFSTKFDYKKMNFKLFRKKIISKIKKLEKKNIFNENIIVNVFFRTPFDIKKYMKCIIYKKNRDIYFIKPDIKISQLKKLIFNHGN